MDWLLIVLMFIAAIAGFIVMGRLQKFTNAIDEEQIKSQEASVLIIGETPVAYKTMSFCKEADIAYDSTQSIGDIKHFQSYRFIFILSSDDVNNLLVIKLLNEYYSDCTIFTICNDKTNTSFFSNTCYLIYNDNEEEILLIIKQMLNGVVKNDKQKT
ncbi:MAG: hypothetical protein PHC84_01095 [Clostridia bacterium]|nr:hypothetical protein [Clostridia bacterium]